MLAPVIGQFLVVFFLGVNTPVGDEFFHVPFLRELREGGDWLAGVWRQHNEHRIVPVKLTIALLEPFAGWNLKVEMYVSAVLAGLTVLGMWRLYRRAGGTDLLFFAPVAWLFCNLSQYENMLYGLLMCHYFTTAGAVWALVFLARRSGAGLLLAVLCGLVASLSVLNGLLIWPLGLLLLLAWGERPSRTGAWLLAGAAASALYFLGFTKPAGLAAMHPGLKDVPNIAGYAFVALGSPLAAGSVDWGAVAGLALLAAIAGFVLRWFRQGRERLRDDALLAALMSFGLWTCAIIAAGRALSGIPPLESRYVAYTSLAFAGAYLLVARAAERSRASGRAFAWLAAALALLVPGVIAADLQGLRNAKLWRVARLRDQFLLQTYDRQPDAVLGDPGFVTLLRGSFGPYLQAERLAAFSEPQRVLILTRWDEHKAAGPVFQGRPVELRLPCPVHELRDFGVTLSREAPPDPSTVSLSLWTGGRRLAVRDVPVYTLASGWVGWVAVRLPETLRDCRGRELIVRIETADARPATNVTVWTYPAYYEATARQGGQPFAPGRSVGLLLNAYHYGLQK